jgi:hypothetical protein
MVQYENIPIYSGNGFPTQPMSDLSELLDPGRIEAAFSHLLIQMVLLALRRDRCLSERRIVSPKYGLLWSKAPRKISSGIPQGKASQVWSLLSREHLVH